MKIPPAFNIKLRVLTPVHIGTGEELASMDYVALRNKKRFYRLSQKDFLKFLQQEEVIENGPRAFADWISERFAALKDIKDNREQSRLIDLMNPYEFCVHIGQEKAFEQYLQEPGNTIFNASVVFDSRTERIYGKKKAVPLGRIREAIKTAKAKPMLPGSSIKGAIRTAVFYHYLTKHADDKAVERLLMNQLEDKRVRKERFALPLIHEAFYCQTKDLDRNRIKKDDEKMDLFKLLRCTDAHLVPDQEKTLQLAKVNIYLVEKQQSRDRRQTNFVATQQRQTSYCETIKAGTLLQTALDFDITFLLQMKQRLKEGSIRVGNQLQWIGIEQKVAQLFGIQLSELNEYNQEEMRQKVFQHLYQCLQSFNQRQLEAYDKWLAHFKKNDQRDQYTSKITSGSVQVKHRTAQPMLHLGYATGFDGMTALHYFLDNEKRKILFKQVMARFGLGNKPGNRGRYVPNPDRFPKSKRMVDMGATIQPMGWLELFAGDEAIPPLETADDNAIAATPSPASNEAQAPVVATYYEGKINYKRPPELDAVVVLPGKPNRVKVYITEAYSPELPLMGYRNPLDKGDVIIVQGVFNKKGKLVQVSFKRRKG